MSSMSKWIETGTGKRPDPDGTYFIRWNPHIPTFDPEVHTEFEEGYPIDKGSGLWIYGISHYRIASGTIDDAIKEFQEQFPTMQHM